eukprot:124553-Amphidinium_carterae.1
MGGFPIVGKAVSTGNFEPNAALPEVSEWQLSEGIAGRNLGLIHRVAPSDDKESDAELWRLTLQE